MRQPILLIPAAVGASLFAVAAMAGPVLATGGILAVGLVALIYAMPMIGLAFMFVTGTVLQVLGSEHFIGLPLSLNKISAGLTLSIWAVRSIILRVPLTRSRQVYAMLAFILVVAATGAVSPDPQESREGFVRYIQVVLLMVMIANIAGESQSALDVACIALSGSMVASTLLGLAEFLLPSLMVEFDDPSLGQGTIGAVVDRDTIEGVEIKRITGGIGDSNWFGYTLALVLPINLYLFYRYQAPLARLFIVGAAGLQSMGVILSFTRSAILGAGVAVIWLVIRGRLPLKPLLLAGAIGIAGFAAWNPAGLERVYSTSYAQGGSTPVRTVMTVGGLELISRSPIIGYGYNQYGPNLFAWMMRQHDLPPDAVAWERALYTQAHPGDERLEWINAHNTYIQLWVEFGLPGMLAFAALIYFMVRELRIASRLGNENQRILADCLLASALGFIVCCVFGSLLLTKISWFITGLAAALYRVTTTQARLGQG